MPNYRCPSCGNRGEPGASASDAFEIRGQANRKHIFKCGQCGAGLVRRGTFSNKLTQLPADFWADLERQWHAQYGK